MSKTKMFELVWCKLGERGELTRRGCLPDEMDNVED